MGTGRWKARFMTGAVIAGAMFVGFASTATAHSDIASSDPVGGSTIDAPISQATIEFIDPVANDVRLDFLDGNENPIQSVTTMTSPTVAVVSFDPIVDKGTYFVRYQATTISDGHLLIGAISFRYGSAGSGMGVGVWIGFGVCSLLILGIGVAVSLRNAGRIGAD